MHSPFAFSLIKFTLAEKGEYYAYERLRLLPYADFSSLSLVFRLVCRFRPEAAAVIAPDASLEAAVKAADSRCRICSSLDAPFVVINNPPRLKLDSLPDENIVFFCDLSDKNSLEAWNIIRSRMARGMAFSDGRRGLLCRLNNLPRQDFNIFF